MRLGLFAGTRPRALAGGLRYPGGVSLWTLYYTAFELVAFNLFAIPWLWSRARRRLWPWLVAQGAALALFAPWLPIALRQAFDPPVPPWRQAVPLGDLLARVWQEGATALAAGQSLDPGRWWPLGALALLVAAIAFGMRSRLDLRRPAAGTLLLWVTIIVPVAIIVLLSQLLSPIYHVRYLFLFSGAMPVLMAAGLVVLGRSGWAGYNAQRRLGMTAVSAAAVVSVSAALLAGTAISLRNYFGDRYAYEAADDLRGAVGFISDHLGPRDAILVNAGYLYPALIYYWPGQLGWIGRLNDYPPPASAVGPGPIVVLTGHVDGDPDIGWGLPSSDFFALSSQETAAGLSRLFASVPAVWELRGYDTVNDPQGFIRAWLDKHGLKFADEVEAGGSFMRVQAWRPLGSPPAPDQPLAADFDGLRLSGFDLAPDPPVFGAPLRLTLYWQRTGPVTRAYKVFTQVLSADDSKIAQNDAQPLLGAYPTDRWQLGEIVASSFVLPLPAGPAPGVYRLVTGLYDEATGERLHLANGDDRVVLATFSLPIHLPDQAQAHERQPGLYSLDNASFSGEKIGVTAGGDDPGFLPQLGPEAPHQFFHQPYIAEDQS